jgi:hypothetical protein
MTVEKFRSIEEMNAARVRSRTEDGAKRFLQLCARYHRIAPRRWKGGLFRFRTIEEARRQRPETT